MRNKKIKIIITLLILIFFSISLTNIVMATEEKKDNFDFGAFDKGDTNVDEATKTTMGTAITAVRVVGFGTAVIMLSYIGIKYMMAAPSEKADFKKSLAIYIVGAILVVGASNLFGIVVNFYSDNIDVSISADS